MAKITFRLNDKQYEELKAYAKSKNENVSQAIRAMITIEVSRWILETPSRILADYF